MDEYHAMCKSGSASICAQSWHGVVPQGAFQIIETTSMFRPVCKWTKQVCGASARLWHAHTSRHQELGWRARQTLKRTGLRMRTPLHL